MMKGKWFPGLFFFSILFSLNSSAQSLFYDLQTIQKIEIYFSQPNWDYQLDTSRYGADDYVIADWVQVNGIQFDSVGVKYKGNSSYDSTYAKNPVHIELDAVINQSYQGITDIKLGNGYADPSVIREVLAYDVLKNYMDCPRANFAQLYINGNYIGVYSNDESINKEFCSAHFNSSKNTFFKCNPVVNPGPTTKSSLRYIPLADSSAYFNFYELKSDYGWNELVQLCDTVTNYPASIGNVLDMDRVMWMLAFNAVLVNLDSYTGVFCQNYYLYKDKTDRFNPVVWDLNMAFGGFPYVGSGNSSLGSLTVTNMQQLSPTFHEADPYWPLINVVMNNPVYRKMFIAHARTINNENFVNGAYATVASQLQSIIDTAVQSDNNSFFSYTQFQNGLTADQPFGSYTVPGISNLMGARVSYLQGNTDFAYIPPVITAVTPSTLTPLFNTTVSITANVSSSTAVYLGYRYKRSDKFERIFMYDDGTHNDGAAGDQVFGVSINVSSLDIQYYVYAENANAGMFSPERAEFEFYELTAYVPLPFLGQVTINEFLADNVNDTVNETGMHSDWIELRNNSSVSVDLFGLYLTDDITNPDKYNIPENTIIPANDYLVIWADEENATTGNLHANFKLSQNGEGIWMTDGNTNILDSVTFGPQATDISYGRCPNGTGPFTALSPSTFHADNCALNVIKDISRAENLLSVFPNPFHQKLNFSVSTAGDQNYNLAIKNIMGQVVYTYSGNLNDGNQKKEIDFSFLSNGVYFMEFKNDKVSVIKKTIKQ